MAGCAPAAPVGRSLTRSVEVWGHHWGGPPSGRGGAFSIVQPARWAGGARLTYAGGELSADVPRMVTSRASTRGGSALSAISRAALTSGGAA